MDLEERISQYGEVIGGELLKVDTNCRCSSASWLEELVGWKILQRSTAWCHWVSRFCVIILLYLGLVPFLEGSSSEGLFTGKFLKNSRRL